MFTAQSIGEYKFCFNNEMSTFAEKMVDFEIAVRYLRIWNQQPHTPSSRDPLFVNHTYNSVRSQLTNSFPF